MNNTLSTIAGAAGWLLFLLTLVASYFEYVKKNDPEVAEKMKHVGTFAEWAVSLQDTLDKPNPDKLASATNEVLKQADTLGIKLTAEMARGAVERAVAGRKNASGKLSIGGDKFAKAATDRAKEAMTKSQAIRPEDLASGKIQGVSVPKIEPTEVPAKPADDDVHDLLDDLEVK